MAEVYALCCPDTGTYRYIGYSTRSARDRYRHHMGDDALGPIRDWVRALTAAGKPKPALKVLESGLTYREARAKEAQLIRELPNLLNRPNGPKHVRRRAVVSHKYDSDVIPGQNMLKWWKERTNLIKR